MIRGDKIINDLINGDAIQTLATNKNISMTEARAEMSKLSFKDYRELTEAPIVPPSGNTIGPSSNSVKPSSTPPKPQSGAGQMKSIWPGAGAPVEMGMTVGIMGRDGKPAPGQVSQVDQSANGVKVKNPVTNQDEWMNMDDLQAYQDDNAGTAAPTQETTNLQRLRELAGIRENCSAGATGAGAIAMAPAAMAPVKKRSGTTEQKKEYTRETPAKTIVGDTKPGQASGELSATLAANGKRTASRINNGRQRK